MVTQFATARLGIILVNIKPARHELRFHPLHSSRPVFAFRCDAHGEVDLDQLSHRDRNNYLYARVFIGREFARPSVEVCDPA